MSASFFSSSWIWSKERGGWRSGTEPDSTSPPLDSPCAAFGPSPSPAAALAPQGSRRPSLRERGAIGRLYQAQRCGFRLAVSHAASSPSVDPKEPRSDSTRLDSGEAAEPGPDVPREARTDLDSMAAVEGGICRSLAEGMCRTHHPGLCRMGEKGGRAARVTHRIRLRS